MKEMVYGEYKETNVLHSGEYEGYRFSIISYGNIPCAYVERKRNNAINIGDIVVHGGITYSFFEPDKEWRIPNPKHMVLGWDYGHYGDYDDIRSSVVFQRNTLCMGLKKWKTEEIFEDVKFVIRQLQEMEK